MFHQFSPTWSDGKKTQVALAEVEASIVEHHRLYGFSQVTLDQYNSAATIQRLAGQIRVKELTWTTSSKTEAYAKLRELINGGNLEMYAHPKAVQGLKGLTVKYRANGSWDVSGGSGAAVDDFASALAGCVLIAQQQEAPRFLPPQVVTYRWGYPVPDQNMTLPESPYQAWKRRQQ